MSVQLLHEESQEINCFVQKMAANATNNTEQGLNKSNKDDGTKMNMDDYMDTELNIDRMRKCTQCRRYTYGHTPPYGSRCAIERKRDKDIEEENRETLEKRRRMLKEKKDKEDNVEQETLEENVVNEQEILSTSNSEI